MFAGLGEARGCFATGKHIPNLLTKLSNEIITSKEYPF